MIVIVDYGLGNLRSVAGAVERVGFEPLISNRVSDFEASDKLILAGVGAFGDGMANLENFGVVDALNEQVQSQEKLILGICLGAQLMGRESYEFGRHQGLGWIDATVKKLEPADVSLRLPHIGWNDFFRVGRNPLLTDVPEEALFYYVHSYHIDCDDQSIVFGKCEYGMEFTAAFQQGNIYGTQFHPEKSQLHGLTLLKNFLELG